MKDERLIRYIEDHRFFVIICNAISCWIKINATFIKVQSKNDIVPSSSERIKMKDILRRDLIVSGGFGVNASVKSSILIDRHLTIRLAVSMNQALS